MVIMFHCYFCVFLLIKMIQELFILIDFQLKIIFLYIVIFFGYYVSFCTEIMSVSYYRKILFQSSIHCYKIFSLRFET